MRFSEEDYKAYESLCFSKVEELKKNQVEILKRYYDNIIVKKDYIMAIGDIPIALVSHMDTVFDNPPKITLYDRQKGVIWAPGGMGADDRAGIFAIDYILNLGYKPTVIFTDGEESGGVGAKSLIKDFPTKPTDIKYVIELDRAHEKDCVFYDCDNKHFIEYVEKFGFKFDYGSFTDISFICPQWGMAGVNLSIGYYNEHSSSEMLMPQFMMNTIEKTTIMLSQDDIPFFEYIPDKTNNVFFQDAPSESDVKIRCASCGNLVDSYDMMEAQDVDGEVKIICDDCIVNKGDFCPVCGIPYILPEKEIEERNYMMNPDLCHVCRKGVEDWKRQFRKSKKNLIKLSSIPRK